MRVRSLACLAATVVVLAACKRSNDKAPPAAVTAPADPGDAAAAPARVSEAAVRALVDAWLDAQNHGDFAAYQGLYAERMTGIKRVGVRRWQFDRAGWLADRGRMFKKAMTVAATEVTVQAGATSAVVSFVQRFEQGRFADQGPKELVVIMSPGGLRIAREEMKASTLVAAAPGAAHAPSYGLVLTAGDSYVVLSADEADPVGPVETLPSGDGFDFATRAPVRAPDAPLAALIGSAATVYPGGAACTIDGLYHLSLGTPHFGEVQAWSGDTDGDGKPDEAPVPESERHATYVSYTVGHLVGACGGDVAVLGAGAAAEWKVVADEAVAKQVRRSFARHPRYREIQADFEAEEEGATGAWFNVTGDDEATAALAHRDAPVRVFEARGGQRLAVVGAAAGIGCGAFEGSLFVAYRIDGDKLVELGELDSMPTAAVEIAGAAMPILVSANHVATWQAGAAGKPDHYVAEPELDLGFRDCPC